MALINNKIVSKKAPIIVIIIRIVTMSTTRKRRNPADFIKQLKERPVEVKLNDNSIFKGKLNGLDGTMNILLSDAKEVVGEECVEEWKMLLIRGNNIMYIKKDY